MRGNLLDKILVMTIAVAILGSGISTILSFGDTDSLRKQTKKGIAIENMICRSGNVLVILASDKPACLKPSTASRLEERGYIKSTIQEFTHTTSLIDNKSVDSSNIQYEDLTPIKEDIEARIESQIREIPASAGSTVNFYVIDDDLNTSRNGVDVILTRGLLEFTINGIPIEGPETMIETGPNTGQFYVRLELPETVNGTPIKQDDVVEIKYLDQSNSSGERQISVKSVPLGKFYAQIQTSDKTGIGHEFVVRVYEPDANLDSKDVDRIPSSRLEYRGEGGIRTTLANPAFDANSSFLRETGENTGIFEITIKIPRTIDGDTVQIGDWYEIRYADTSTPSNTKEEIKMSGKIGR
jgi:hypothetical protein